ncbi:hypothetical protein FRACYDRAFT_272021 [Fragilariopsis cylindrus CCMP1102]|uniref:Uncharacterized protein n=1 Tax=Fragilariopsis cylindrus CCMP1102 TaxID=635003 RepID=A0A1E7EMV9_9STRA|nr:hypothetical protein FRACYDRAFT_272021 [Fragilariopsis cylindrus CCMP1102]|eukprot:OEU07270.1 hypothetical protein FRACYDRAFT_272021 [Fragilariopsis cylindrus CCMP1102]
MLSHKQHGSYDMAEDVYAFIVAAPIFSWSFLFASYVIATKYIVYATLLNGIYFKELGGADPAATAVKFFLIPVAIAMQSDLMAVYEYLANVRYDKEVLTISSHATFTKFVLAYILRLADGVLSLSVNFGVMLVTDEVLGVFLNFAALHFLQDIDDVFYSLVEKGFFGDRLEHMATICKQISWPRRVGNEDCWKSSFITSLDTILFTTTLVILLSMFIAITVRVEQGKSILGYDLEGEE